ncbi:hypothetical protein HID58_076317, partial [Brassica napus]
RRQRLAVSASMITQQMIEQGVLDCLLEEGETDDALMGILRVIHKITESNNFVIAANDDLFDFFSNKEVIELLKLLPMLASFLF